MATHSSVLAWKIPGMGEPGGLQSMGSKRVGHDWSDLAAAAAALGKTLHFMFLSLFFFSYLISCCFSEHTVISAVLQTSQPLLPLFHCLCASVTKNANPLRKNPTALKFYFSFHANIKRWLLQKMTLMLPTWVCALPCLSRSRSDCTLESKHKLYRTQQRDT